MTTRIVECFDVQQWDGGERHNHDCYITNEKDAKTRAGRHGLVSKQTFIIHDSLADIELFKNGEIKRQALAKLTDVERAALGLKF